MPFPLSGLTEEQTKYAIRLNPLALAEAYMPQYKWTNWHFREIVDAVTSKNSDGTLTNPRVMIIGPRGSIKSTLSGTILPPWFIGQNPVNESVAFVTHTQSFSEDFVRAAKNIIDFDPAYRATFPNLQTDMSTQSKVVLRCKAEKFVPSIEAFGVGGTVIGRHPKHWFIDDIIDFNKRWSIAAMERSKEWLLMALLPAVMEDQQIVINCCLPETTNILIGDGSWRQLQNVNVGDKVLSYYNKALTKRTVLAKIPQGKMKILEIKTKHLSIRASKNHPFLVFKTNRGLGNMVGTDGAVEWRRADQLKVGDAAIVLSHIPNEPDCDLHLPDGRCMTKDFLWFLGYLFGDGWANIGKRNRGYVCVAKSVYPDLNNQICSQIKKWFGHDPYETSGGYYRIDNIASVRLLKAIGFYGNAKTKRIPNWIFQTSTECRREFLKGLIDADGYKFPKGYSYRIQLSNRKLIEDCYWLALTCGVRPNKILSMTRFLHPPHTKEPRFFTSWHLGLTFTNQQAFGEHFRWDRITEINEWGEEEVFDLTIDETSNFVANGYVVHNTRWGADDAYSVLMRENSEKPVNKRFKIIHIPALGEEQYPMAVKHGYVGKSFWEDGPWPLDKLLEKKAELDPTSWMTQFQGDVSLEIGREFDDSWLKDRRYEKQPDLKEFAVIVQANDLSVSVRDTRRGSRFASITLGLMPDGDFYVLDAYKMKLTGPDQLKAIKTRYELYHPLKIGLEKEGQQDYVAQFASQDKEFQLLPIVPISSTTARDSRKSMRIRSLIPFFSAKRVWIGQGMTDLEKELITFRGDRPKDCDLLDALEMAFRLLQTEERRRGYSRGS